MFDSRRLVPTARRSRRGNGSQHARDCGHIMIPNKTWFWSRSLQDGFTPWGCCDVVTPKRFQRLWRLKILSQEQWSILINTTLGYIQRSPAAARHLILIPLYLILIWINRSSQFPLWRWANYQKNNCVVHFTRHISPMTRLPKPTLPTTTTLLPIKLEYNS